jgi:hypothetical protein
VELCGEECVVEVRDHTGQTTVDLEGIVKERDILFLPVTSFGIACGNT